MAILSGISAYSALQAQTDKALGAAGNGLAGLGAGKGLSGTDGLGGGAGVAGVQGSDFGDMLKQVMTEAVGQSRAAEQAMAAQVTGQADLIDVVTALSAAETSLETMMAVRDQVISAYQEIMRMPI